MAFHLKLGKKAPRHDPRTFKLTSYLNYEELPPAPESCDWSTKVQRWGMMANDRMGNCTVVGAAHLIQAWTANELETEVVIPDEQVIRIYSEISGYDPETGMNDNGAVLLDVLNYWRNKGISGHKIGAYVKVNEHDLGDIKNGLYLFGGLYIGLNLPLSSRRQTGEDRVWKVTSLTGEGEKGSLGGHCVCPISYDKTGIMVSTWGTLQKMDWEFLETYCDEAFAVLGYDWVSGDGKSPTGLNIAQLQADLRAL